jgi:hypothetical protein
MGILSCRLTALLGLLGLPRLITAAIATMFASGFALFGRRALIFASLRHVSSPVSPLSSLRVGSEAR